MSRVSAVHPLNVADNHDDDLGLVNSETGYFGTSEHQNAFAFSFVATQAASSWMTILLAMRIHCCVTTYCIYYPHFDEQPELLSTVRFNAMRRKTAYGLNESSLLWKQV